MGNGIGLSRVPDAECHNDDVCVAQIESLIAEYYGHFMTNYLSYTTHNTNKTDTIIHVLLITQFHANYNFILSVRTVTFLLSLHIEQ